MPTIRSERKNTHSKAHNKLCREEFSDLTSPAILISTLDICTKMESILLLIEGSIARYIIYEESALSTQQKSNSFFLQPALLIELAFI